ncbi:DNA polymerase III subunit delta [Deinococcus lacus]|uniref:DNA-directed DNA polymerase n=1 Tax=Deinococcus lacus TaxID=392561 RepID=A0ABW1YAY7_9DEIO
MGWLKPFARAAGVPLEPEAAQYLAEVFGSDLAGIASELNKLAVLGGPLDRDSVQRVVGREPAGDSFAMLAAAAAGKAPEALAQLRRLLLGGEDPFRLLGAVVWQYSLIARCVALQAEMGRVTDAQAAQRLGVKPYPARKALEVARRLDERRIHAHLRRIQAADLALKQGRDPQSTLERLLVGLSV